MSDQNKNQAGTVVIGQVPPKEDVLSMLGEGLHTSLRKACDSKEANEVWHLIQDMPDWSDALDSLYWGLRYSGWEIVKVEEQA